MSAFSSEPMAWWLMGYDPCSGELVQDIELGAIQPALLTEIVGPETEDVPYHYGNFNLDASQVSAFADALALDLRPDADWELSLVRTG